MTGASGFIGQEVIKLCIARKHRVLALTRSHLAHCKHKVFSQLHDVNVRDIEGHDAIIHLAGIAHSKEASSADYYKHNTELTIHLAEVAAQANVKRFVFVSSIGVNGKYTRGNPFRGADFPNPHNDYTKSKLEAELGLKKVASQTGLEVVIIRPTLVYGATAPGNFKLLKTLVSMLPILPFGSINNRRSFIFVKNLADLIELCSQHPLAAGQTFLASDGKSVSIKEFTNQLAIGLDKTIFQLPIPSSVMLLVGRLTNKSEVVKQLIDDLEVDSSCAGKLLDWKPPYSLEKAMLHMNRDIHD